MGGGFKEGGFRQKEVFQQPFYTSPTPYKGVFTGGGVRNLAVLKYCGGTVFGNVGGGTTEPKLFGNEFGSLFVYVMVVLLLAGPVVRVPGWAVAQRPLRQRHPHRLQPPSSLLLPRGAAPSSEDRGPQRRRRLLRPALSGGMDWWRMGSSSSV